MRVHHISGISHYIPVTVEMMARLQAFLSDNLLPTVIGLLEHTPILAISQDHLG